MTTTQTKDFSSKKQAQNFANKRVERGFAVVGPYAADKNTLTHPLKPWRVEWSK